MVCNLTRSNPNPIKYTMNWHINRREFKYPFKGDFLSIKKTILTMAWDHKHNRLRNPDPNFNDIYIKGLPTTFHYDLRSIIIDIILSIFLPLFFLKSIVIVALD